MDYGFVAQQCNLQSDTFVTASDFLTHELTNAMKSVFTN